MGKRNQLARLLDRSGALRLLLHLRRHAPSPWLPVFTYHRICRPCHPYRFDEELIDGDPEQFDRQMAIVKRHFNPIAMDDLFAFTAGGSLPPNPVMITFDDGYRDNCEDVLTILVRHGVPATFFVVTSSITRRRVFWWDRISYLVKQTSHPLIRLGYPSARCLDVRDERGRLAAIRTLLDVVKSERGLDLERFLGELAEAAGVPWTDEIDRAFADELLMTWDQVRALRAAGMGVQSHTRTHRLLQTLDDGAILDELAGSRADLERELGGPVHAIAYPAGRGIDDRASVRPLLREAGFTLGFVGGAGPQRLGGRFDPLAIKRIHADLSPSLFRAALVFPSLAD